jgi:hypothetical protein
MKVRCTYPPYATSALRRALHSPSNHLELTPRSAAAGRAAASARPLRTYEPHLCDRRKCYDASLRADRRGHLCVNMLRSPCAQQ